MEVDKDVNSPAVIDKEVLSFDKGMFMCFNYVYVHVLNGC